MNHSEQVALQFLVKTRAWVADPAFQMPDWSTIFILSLAVLVFVCTLLSSE